MCGLRAPIDWPAGRTGVTRTERQRAARRMLDGIGRAGFAERAHRELPATGATVRNRGADRRSRM